MGVVDLRMLLSEDWRLWREVRLLALADAPAAFGATLASWSGAGDTEERWRNRLEDVPLNLVAMDNDLPVGQASGTAVDEIGRVELISMWVSPTMRGTGVAGALIDAVAVWARGAGATGVRLSVRRTNERAVRSYLRNGFRHTDEPGDEPAELAMLRPL